MELTVLRAKASLLGHTHGCQECGWTGKFADLRNRRTSAVVIFPICNCPSCGVTKPISWFKVYNALGNAVDISRGL